MYKEKEINQVEFVIKANGKRIIVANRKSANRIIKKESKSGCVIILDEKHIMEKYIRRHTFNNNLKRGKIEIINIVENKLKR
jgi:hypothetical protein